MIVYSAKVDDAGRIERGACSRLSQYNIGRAYEKDGFVQEATEIFCCSFSKGRDALAAEIADKPTRIWQSPQKYLYEFVDGDLEDPEQN